jgi:hypothetical protein
LLFLPLSRYIHCVNRIVIALAATLALSVGCKPKQDTPRPVDPAPATPKADAANAAAPAEAATTFASTQERLTQSLRKFGAEQQRVPKSLAELVSAGYLGAIPSAPSGKKWKINPQRMQVELD